MWPEWGGVGAGGGGGGRRACECVFVVRSAPGRGGGAAPPRAAQPTRTPGGISGRALIEAVVPEGKVDRKAGARRGRPGETQRAVSEPALIENQP